eukprot:CAMPEP_0174723522 /NCGR_PEP_ID=MMETSP1094-20130205/41187_1 /TAXON_ID=156173 /ORGANISM="Chrysochromulina brevifilum, Strain UTEX LB 985" /LENGTH=79 /DNA_ID=CAMNT_0015924583 /DNA_START=406 /DNA_END=645 /DNA_ORIENTATION=+
MLKGHLRVEDPVQFRKAELRAKQGQGARGTNSTDDGGGDDEPERRRTHGAATLHMAQQPPGEGAAKKHRAQVRQAVLGP